MLKRALEFCGRFRLSAVMLCGLLLACAIEALTVFMRFGLALESTRDTRLLAHLTFGLRVHHGYVGLVLLIAAWLFRTDKGVRNVLLVLGITLLASDLAHHFLVLWPVTGSPQFDVVYPPT